MPVILFDIDGTLLSSGGAGKAAMEAALASAFGAVPSTAAIPFAGRTDRSISRDLLQLHQIEETETNRTRFLSDYLSHLPGCLARHDGKVLPGIAALLDRLAARSDMVLGLLTGNVRAGAHIKLAHYGLLDFFVLGGYGDEHFHRDDVAREALAFVHQHLNGSVALDEVWVIGDTPLDVGCARAIGARVAAVATGWHSVEHLAEAKPDLLFADLSDPTRLLERLT